MRARGTTGAGVLVALLVLGLGGCATSSQPSALATRLTQVDQALSVRNFAAARSELSSLAADTRAALAAGNLTSTDATRILGAISALSATLPATPSATVKHTPAPPVIAPRPPDHQKKHDKGHGHPGDGKAKD